MLRSHVDTPRAALLAGVPAGQRRIEAAGTTTTVLEGGNGPPLVLLHGPGGNATDWIAVAPALVGRHRMIAPDLPGHGGSDPSDDPVAWLAALIDATCATPPVLVGNTAGGALAAEFAREHGDRVARLVLVDALGLVPFAPAPEFGAALQAFMTQPTRVTHDRLWARCAFDLDRLRGRMGERWEPFTAQNLERAGSPEVAALMGRFGMSAIDGLESIAVPTALIWGRQDLATPLTVAEAASARHGWPLHVIADCADAPQLEQPEAFVRALDAERLRERLHGPLLVPADAGFAEVTRLWNGAIVKSPSLIVQPTGTADVVAAVNFAHEHGRAIAVRGGGHNIAGTALADGGVTIDMSRLRDVVVDAEARTAMVAPGAHLGDVDAATQRHGLATPLGFVSEVGVAGLTLGGGLGYLTRRFGWTVDNLLAVEIVTADGRVRTASRDENADLFWGVRGAGANLGVVTSFTFRLHEVGPTIVGGLVAWPFVRAAEILDAYRTITRKAPRELAVWCNLLRAPAAPFVPAELQGEQVCAMAVCFSGDLAAAEEALAPIRLLGDPVFDLLAQRPYTEMQSLLDATEPKGEHYYWRTEYAAELSDELIANQIELAAACPIPAAQVGVLHVGGALNEHPPDDGVVGNRDARYACGVLGAWSPSASRADEYRRWVREGGESMRPFSTGGSYINFQTDDEDVARVRASYGANYDRLVATKRRYDPGNVFRSNRNVAPS
jgi:FAD/FMN-containing dehydrogenase/pimeloyl-ACP methyl ester carboxylesterase